MNASLEAAIEEARIEDFERERKSYRRIGLADVPRGGSATLPANRFVLLTEDGSDYLASSATREGIADFEAFVRTSGGEIVEVVA